MEEASDPESGELLEMTKMASSNEMDTGVDERSRFPTEEYEGRQTSPPKGTMTTFSVYKNLTVYSFSFMLMFTALASFANLQSTLNIAGGLGTTGEQ